MGLNLQKGEHEIINEIEECRFSLKRIASMKETRRQRSENHGVRKKG